MQVGTFARQQHLLREPAGIARQLSRPARPRLGVKRGHLSNSTLPAATISAPTLLTHVSDSLIPRLRYAYGTLGGFLAGQANSNFADPDANPETLDFGGPGGRSRHRPHSAGPLYLCRPVGQRFLGVGRNSGDRRADPGRPSFDRHQPVAKRRSRTRSGAPPPTAVSPMASLPAPAPRPRRPALPTPRPAR